MADLATLVALLEQKAALAPRAAADLPADWIVMVGADETDSERDIALREVDDGPLSVSLGIAYVDAKADRSVRRVRVRSLALRPDGDLRAGCWCYERKAARAFLVSRMQAAVNLRTGEIFDSPPVVRRAFDTWFADAVSPADETLMVLKAHRHAVNLLSYLARSDGEHPAETEVMLWYLDGAATGRRLDEVTARRALAALDVDETAYRAGLRWLEKQDEQTVRNFARHARQLIEADGEISQTEAKLGAALDATLRG